MGMRRTTGGRFVGGKGERRKTWRWDIYEKESFTGDRSVTYQALIIGAFLFGSDNRGLTCELNRGTKCKVLLIYPNRLRLRLADKRLLKPNSLFQTKLFDAKPTRKLQGPSADH